MTNAGRVVDDRAQRQVHLAGLEESRHFRAVGEELIVAALGDAVSPSRPAA